MEGDSFCDFGVLLFGFEFLGPEAPVSGAELAQMVIEMLVGQDCPLVRR
jgi:hypothetical protein